MARVSTYLNFIRSTETALLLYKSVFGGEFNGPVRRFADVPAAPNQPPMAEADQTLAKHVERAVLADHMLMGTGASGSMGLKVTRGDTTHRNLEPDSRADTDQPIAALAAGGQIDMPLQDMFWGGYFGSLTDEFGVRQMVNCAGKG